MKNGVEARSVAKTYGTGDATVHALNGVSLAAEPGEFVAVMGPSGCGKSTLLHILGGLDRATSGEVWLGGEQVDGYSESQWAIARRSRVGFVFQSFNLVSNLTVAQNLEVPALLNGLSRGRAKRRREALLEDLGIADRSRALPSELSGGQMQRAAIARALVNNPDVLLADEPTGNLDSRASEDVRTILKQQNARGQTIVLVTHDPRVTACADRVVHLRHGRMQTSDEMGATHDASRLLSRFLTSEVGA